MRKKSHFSLVQYLMNSVGMEELREHKTALYIGSILPDCTPSFITRKHSIDETFELLRTEINKITIHYNANEGISNYYCRHLGIITHYIADYFTYPHNAIFAGSLKEHCIYENDLKKAFRTFVKSDEAKKVREKNATFYSVDDICSLIHTMHEEYLKVKKEVRQDCIYIVELCYRVVDAILCFLELTIKKSHTNTIPVTVS